MTTANEALSKLTMKCLQNMEFEIYQLGQDMRILPSEILNIVADNYFLRAKEIFEITKNSLNIDLETFLLEKHFDYKEQYKN